MATADRRWYHLHLGTKILLALMIAGAAHEVYAAVYDIFYGPAGDPCPELDILEIGVIFTVIAVVTAVTEWLARSGYLQLHLSTAFLLMLLASGCVWRNVQPSTLHSTAFGGWSVEGRGWPCSSYSVWCRELKDAQTEIANESTPYEVWMVNGFICFGMLFVVAFICEWRIRAGQRAKAASEHTVAETAVPMTSSSTEPR